MRGHFGVLRYRAILTGIGSLSALAFTLTSGGAFSDAPMVLALTVCTLAVADTAYTWTVGDDQKVERKQFRQRLDRLETRLLELKAQGAAVAQAASLLTTAKEEGSTRRTGCACWTKARKTWSGRCPLRMMWRSFDRMH